MKMPDTEFVIWEQLRAPFPERQIRWRVSRSTMRRDGEIRVMVVPYIDARDVMDRLDSVLGPENWWDEYVPHERGFICRLTLVVDGKTITKMDAAGYTKVEDVKGGISDAFKRSAVKFGCGRYLYDASESLAIIDPQSKNRCQVKPPRGQQGQPKWVGWSPPKLEFDRIAEGTEGKELY